ncbi:hypothetical protein KAR91_60475 [Candidatus Pacearchaeota archaeon]|nr:hypothetical protein [Candidatus Pacearchaeota archaeon]
MKIITDCLEIVPGTQDDYKILKRYHYKKETPSMPDQIYKIRGIEGTNNAFPDPIGVILYSMPIINLHGRTTATRGYFRKARTEIGRLRLVNKKIRYISRFIVDPRFQKLGLGAWLLKDSLERQTVPIVETLTPIDFTNKIFQKQGFKLYHSKAPEWYDRFINALLTVGLAEKNLYCPPAVHCRLQHLTKKQHRFIENEILTFIEHFRHRKGMPNSLERTVFFCSKIPYPRAYLLWQNPRVTAYDLENPQNADKNKGHRQWSGERK